MTIQTTAHTLAFTLGLLALYPDEEEKLYQGIKSVLADGRLPVRICSVACKSLYVAHKCLLNADVRGYERPLVLLGVRLALYSSANAFLTYS